MVKKRFLSGRTLLICISTLIFALSLSFGMLFACKPSEFNNNPDMDAIAGQTSTYLPVPTDGTTPADYNANDNVFIAFTVFANQDKVETFSVGSAVTKVGISVTQDIKSHRVVDGKEVYKESLSHSTFKGVGARLYVNGDNYIVHGASKVKSVHDVSWQSSASKISEENYTSLYGYIGNELTGYALTNDTILASRLIEEKDGLYTFEYILDTVDAIGKLSLEMRTMAGTKSVPTFESASLIITMDSNWQVTSLKTNNVYKVEMLGGVTCVENVTETFTYGNEISIPNGDFFRSYLDSDVTEELPEEEVTALDFLMNGFGDYITGTKPLKVDLSLSASETLPLSVQGALELKINLEKLEDLSVTAKLDSITYDGVTINDIIIKYIGGNVYVNKGAFNGVANVNDLMAKVTDLLDTLKVQMPDLEGTLGNFEVGSLLDNATLTEVEGGATINLPLSLAGVDINANLNFTNVEGVVSFTDATVSVAGVNLALSVNEQIDINMTADKYVDLLPLLDVINANGQIKIATEIAGLNIKTIVDLRDLSITAKTEIEGIEVIAKFIDGKIYAKALGVSVYFDTADIETVMNKLSAILGEDLGELAEIELPELDKVNVNDIINAITINDKENGYEIAINLGGISASVNLSTANDELTIEKVSANVNGFELALSPAKFGSFDIGDISNSYNLVTLLDLISDDGEVKLTASIGDINIDAIVDIANMNVTAKTEIEGIEIKAQYADGKIYVNALGLNVFFDTADINSVIEKLSVILGDTMTDLSSSVDLSGFENISGRDIARSIKVSKGENTLTLALDIASIKASVTFNTTDGNLTLASINANVEGTDIAVRPSTIDTIDMGDLDNYDNLVTLLDVINENGEVQLQVVVGDITVDAILDLVNLTVTAKTEIEGIEILVKYADGRIYVNALDLSVYFDIADVESVMEKLAPIIGDGVDQALGSIATSAVEDIDVIELIKSIVVTNNENDVTLTLNAFGVTANVVLSTVNNELKLANVNTAIEGVNISVSPATVEEINMGNLDNYDNLVTLLDVINENGEVQLQVVVGDITVDAILDLVNLTVTARTEIEGIEILVKYADGRIYVNALDLNVYFDTADIESVMEKLAPIIGDSVDQALGSIATSAVEDIDVVELIKSIVVTNNENDVTLTLNAFGVTANVVLSTVNNELKLANVNTAIEGVNISVSPATVEEINMGDLDNYDNLATLLDVINENGEVQLQVVVGDITVDAILDLVNLTVTAKTEIEGIEILVKYADGRIYVNALDLNVYFDIADIESVMEKLAPIIGDGINQALGSVDTSAVENFDAIAFIKSLVITNAGNNINIATTIMGIDASINLSNENDELAISSVVATVEGMNITVTPATISAIDMGDLDNYNDIATLLNIINEDGTITLSANIGDIKIDAIVDIKTLTISARTEIEGIEIIAQYKDGKISASALGLNVCIATSDIETVLNKLNPVIGDTIEESLGAIDTSAISEINVVDLIKSIVVTNGEDAIALGLEVSGIAIKVNLATTNNQLTLTNAVANVEGTEIIITPATVSAIDMGNADKYNDLTTLLDVINESGEIGLALSVGDINVDAIVDLNDLSVTAKTEIEGINLTLKYIDGKIYVKVLGLNIYVATCDFENVMNKLSPIIGNSLDEGLGSIDLTAFENIDVVEIIKSIIVTENENDINLALSLAGINANVTLGTINNSLTFNGVSASVNDMIIEVNPATVNAIDMGDLSICHNVVPLLDLINSNNELQLQAVIGDIKVDAIVNLADMTITAKTEIEGIEIAIEYADGKIYASALGLKIFVNANEIESVMNKLSPIIGDSLNEGLGSIDLTAFEEIDVVEIIKSIVITESEGAIDLAVELAGINVSAKLSTLNNELTFAGVSATLDDMIIEVNPVSVDAIDMGNLTLYNNVVTLLDLINYNNEIQLQAQLDDIVIDATINLIDFTIKAQTNIDGSIVKILFENNTIYFDGFGIHAFVNVNDIQTILETIKPIIDKFVGADALGGLGDIDLSATEEIDVVEIIKSIAVTTDETANTVTLGVEIFGIKLDVVLSTVNNELNLDSVNAVVEGMTITVIDPVSPADIDFVIADNSFNLMTFVDTFGDAALDILIGDSLTGTLSAVVSYNNATYKLSADVQVDGINSAPRANANLTVVITTTGSDGKAKSSTHTIRLVYLDPSLVAEGAVNVYFTYNEGTNASDKLEGTFTTTKADETLTTLKQIYQEIPQLQDLLYPFLTPDEEGMPVMPEIQLEVATIINNVLFNNGVVSADINAKTLMDMLPESMGILLSAPENILTLSIPGADFDGNHIELKVAIGKPADGVITDDTFAYSVTNANDFSTINELLLTLKNTATWSSFNIEADLDINAIGIVNMEKKAKLFISIDMVGDHVYMVVRLRREFYSFGLGLLSLTAWKDYDGDSYLYLDPVAEKIYIYNEFRNADKKWYGFVPGSSGSESFSYTLDEFMADPMTPILKFARLSSTIEDQITKERETVASSATVENTLTSYKYSPAEALFKLQLNLEPLTKDIQKVSADIGHDENMYVNALDAKVKVVSVIELTLGADIMQPYNQYQGTKEKVESMRAKFA